MGNDSRTFSERGSPSHLQLSPVLRNFSQAAHCKKLLAYCVPTFRNRKCPSCKVTKSPPQCGIDQSSLRPHRLPALLNASSRDASDIFRRSAISR